MLTQLGHEETEMIFTPEDCKAILAGRKTQARFVVQEGERLVPDDLWEGTLQYWDGNVRVMSASGKQVRWEVGKTRAIQPGYNKAVGRVLITNIWREKLQDIEPQDAIAEGILPPPEIKSQLVRDMWVVDAFRVLWDKTNGGCWTFWQDNPDVWALTFRLEETRDE
jgi:hypothetical protein